MTLRRPQLLPRPALVASGLSERERSSMPSAPIAARVGTGVICADLRDLRFPFRRAEDPVSPSAAT
jgi:hypothetical protein